MIAYSVEVAPNHSSACDFSRARDEFALAWIADAGRFARNLGFVLPLPFITVASRNRQTQLS
ncbi:hypothetical protein [Pendulispora albinea]|uniref:Uncharacterized protein n=1 Tax=Pendulispora albinea TaxID=2741071 RepID=A0ABZ2LQS4_9BACT